NSLFLYCFGAQIETLYGWRKYLIIYLVAGVAGNLFSFLLSPGPSLGASGALFGLVGAGIVFPLRFRSLVPARARAEILRQLLTVVVVNLMIGFMPGSHIDNWAHLSSSRCASAPWFRRGRGRRYCGNSSRSSSST